MASVTVVGALFCASPALAQDANTAQCAKVAGALEGFMKIRQIEYIPAGKTLLKMMAGDKTLEIPAELPAHCVVNGRFEERKGADGKRYGFAMEVRLPRNWNGRMLYQGGGGLNGVLWPATGGQAGNALVRGFAVVGTDSGHDGAETPGATFAKDQLAKINYAYAGIGKVIRVAKTAAERYYGRRPDKTYYYGCSNGGREAMIAAQRYPEEFDGIVAMNPAFELSRAVLLANYSTNVLWSLGKPGVAGAITPADLQLVAKDAVAACDALDGRKDGLIFNHAACRFDPVVLQCRKGQSESCLSAVKVRTIRKAFAGPVDAQGGALYGSWTYDGGIGTPGWNSWQIGAHPFTGKFDDETPHLVRDTLGNYFSYPAIGDTIPANFNYAAAYDRMRDTAGMTDATSTQLSTFASRGGKMILYTGWSDPIFAPTGLTSWYEGMTADMAQSGGDARSFSRLFMNPGVNHCGGGPALDSVDLLTALDEWVVSSKAPDRLIASGRFLANERRPLCPYPAYAHYVTGDGTKPEDYECRTPNRKAQ